MKFDVFHSIGRIDSLPNKLTDRQVFAGFFNQLQLAEDLGYETMWVAESHFSSEVQKNNPYAVIPNYQGEVGLNADTMQLAQVILERTQRIGFGTAIFNIVGGNGGPIAAADRVRSLAWYNSLRADPRRLHIGVASGRFPYINEPFGIFPRDQVERILWPEVTRLIFVEALEIFLRLVRGDTIGHEDLDTLRLEPSLCRNDERRADVATAMKEAGIAWSEDGLPYTPRWRFDRLKLVPEMTEADYAPWLNFVLGSADPMAREVGLELADLDIFNLSFTPPDKLNAIHTEMTARYADAGRKWHRSRLPRTVLVFIDENAGTARARASACFDTYIEAMRGTVKFPPKEELMARALIGTPDDITAAMSPEGEHGFDADDRLMLWFEFNQADNKLICEQMQMFAERVMPHFKSAGA